MKQDDMDLLARKRAGAKLGWYIHATVYLLVNAFLMAFSVWQGRQWAVFPLLGWGLGLAIHGVVVWFTASGSALREGMVERERQKLAEKHDKR